MKLVLKITSILGLFCVLYLSYNFIKREIIVHKQREIAESELQIGMNIWDADNLVGQNNKYFETEFEGKLEFTRNKDSIKTYLIYPKSLFYKGVKLELDLCKDKIISIE